jgi:hypothetical protein
MRFMMFSARTRVSARNFAVSASGRPAFSIASKMLRVFASVRRHAVR